MVTNVAGPNFDLYCAGARLVRYYGLGVLTPGVGLFHALFSSSGVITLSVLADRDHLPDPDFYRQCLEASFEELKRGVLGKTRRPRAVRRAALVKKKATVTRLHASKAGKSPARRKAGSKKVPAKKSGERQKPARSGRQRNAVGGNSGDSPAKPESAVAGGERDDRIIH